MDLPNPVKNNHITSAFSHEQRESPLLKLNQVKSTTNQNGINGIFTGFLSIPGHFFANRANKESIFTNFNPLLFAATCLSLLPGTFGQKETSTTMAKTDEDEIAQTALKVGLAIFTLVGSLYGLYKNKDAMQNFLVQTKPNNNVEKKD